MNILKFLRAPPKPFQGHRDARGHTIGDPWFKWWRIHVANIFQVVTISIFLFYIYKHVGYATLYLLYAYVYLMG
jgi:hypothetical protein